MRRALALAIDQSEGRAAAALHNNLAIALWQHEGLRAALAACREGIDFCERRGITEYVLGIGAISTASLAELGQTEQALAEAEPLAERMEAAGDATFIEMRSLHLRLLAERGAHDHAPPADDLVAAARESGEPQLCAQGFAAGARLLLAQGRHQQANAVLVELERVVGIRSDPYYAFSLPDIVRTAHALGQTELAARLVDGVQPVTPLFEHALAACRAQLAEAVRDHARATALYAEAATRWEEFGSVPERAYALLGQGRCLAALGKPDAAAPLREARELFASMGYEPALAETDELLTRGEAAAAV
jgi:tetratricopeptide (TPR) repeat protein